MFRFEPSEYGTVVAELVEADQLNELGPGRPRDSARSPLRARKPADIIAPHAVHDHDMAACCLSAIWLVNDFLDESHTISQDIHSQEGSYWHGIMHRREPDPSNAKYWYRRVGRHPVFSQLREQAIVIAEETAGSLPRFLQASAEWDPFAFIDYCESCRVSDNGEQLLARKLAQLEWQLLFDYCFHQARQ